MKNKAWLTLGIILTALVFTVSCSKKLMPPEIEASGSGQEGQIDGSGQADSAESGALPGSQESEGLAFLQEESVSESGIPVSPGAPDDMSAMAGGADSPSEGDPFASRPFSENPFADGSGAPPTGDGTQGFGFEAQPPISGSGSPAGGGVGAGGDGTARLGETYGRSPGDAFAGGPGSLGGGAGAGIGSVPGIPGGAAGEAGADGVQTARLFSFRPSTALKDIHFQFDDHDLDQRSRQILKQNAGYLKQHPNIKVEIQGHCDERGTNNYNLALGQRRATSTKNFLASLGIDSSRLHVISYGEEKPFCMESNDSCWSRNRRAHFQVAE